MKPESWGRVGLRRKHEGRLKRFFILKKLEQEGKLTDITRRELEGLARNIQKEVQKRDYPWAKEEMEARAALAARARDIDKEHDRSSRAF